MKNNSILILSLLMFWIYGCASKPTPLNKEDGLHLLSDKENNLNLSLLQTNFPEGFNGYVYIMNSECSTCISSFLDFGKKLHMHGYDKDVLVIISPGTKPLVNHYLKENDCFRKINVLLEENSKDTWNINSMESETGKVYQISNNQIKNTYLFFAN